MYAPGQWPLPFDSISRLRRCAYVDSWAQNCAFCGHERRHLLSVTHIYDQVKVQPLKQILTGKPRRSQKRRWGRTSTEFEVSESFYNLLNSRVVAFTRNQCVAGWWFQPTSKILYSQIGSFPQFSGWNFELPPPRLLSAKPFLILLLHARVPCQVAFVRTLTLDHWCLNYPGKRPQTV